MLLLKPKYNIGGVEYRIKGIPFKEVEPSIIRIKYIKSSTGVNQNSVSKFGSYDIIDNKILEWMDTSIIKDTYNDKVIIPSAINTISIINFLNVNTKLLLCDGIIFYTKSTRVINLTNNNANNHYAFGATIFTDNTGKEHLVINPALSTGIKNLLIKLYRLKLPSKTKPSIIMVNLEELARVTVNPQLLLSSSIKNYLINLIENNSVSKNDIKESLRSTVDIKYTYIYGSVDNIIPDNEILFE